MSVITLKGVGKRYNNRIVLENVNQEFMIGESVAFVGKNGCGKSTLLKLIGGLINPSSGVIGGRSGILFHYVPDKFPKMSMSGRIFLHRMALLDGLSRKEAQDIIFRQASDFNITELLDLPMKSLSKGSLQKISVIQALMLKPDVLLLDEPLSGQDTESQNIFIKKLLMEKEKKTTIFLSAHENYLVEAVADRSFLIENGMLTEKKIINNKLYRVYIENTACKCIWRNMVYKDGLYEITLGEDILDDTILRLINDGWSLRRLVDEENL